MANTAQSKDRAAVKGGLNDLLGNVIRSDRQRSGRAETAAASETPEPAAQAQVAAASPSQPPPSSETDAASPSLAESAGRSDTMTDRHYDIMTSGQATGDGPSPPVARTAQTERLRTTAPESAPKPAARPAQASARRKPAAKPSPSSEASEGRLAERIGEAAELAASQTITVTLRIPQGFNEWLDGYVHGAWPEKIRKQELVVEGLMMAYARRGNPGEGIIPAALLGEEEEA